MPSGAPDYWGTIVAPEVIASYLSDLADVSVPSPTDGYVFYWDAAASKWKCKAVPPGAWADITGKPASPSLEELAAEHEADGTHGAITPISCTQKYTNAEADARVALHAAITTGIHGVGANYVALAPAAAHLIRTFTKGWTSGKYLQGGGVDADPTEVDINAGAAKFLAKYETRDMTAASGNVSYTGYGFSPTGLIIFGLCGTGVSIGCWTTGINLCWGYFAAYQQGAKPNLIWLETSSGNEQHASFVSSEADGFTISWTKVGSPTGTADLAVFAFA